MADCHLTRAGLAGKRIDAHSHVGVYLKAYLCGEFPYAQSLEGLSCMQQAHGVDVNVIFPFGPELYFDVQKMIAGSAVPAAEPVSPVPYAAENALLMRELFDCCPELKGRFLPFVCADPGRLVDAQLDAIRRLETDYPIYGIKISPVLCQMPVTRLLDEGRPLVDFARSRDIPILLHTTADPRETFSHARLVFQVVEANPQVRFCLAHSIAFHRGYLDRAARMDNVWVDTSAATIQVQLAREDSLLIAAGPDRFDADYSDHRRVVKGLVDSYPETILWGSDAPAYSYIVRRRQGEGPDDFEDFRLKATYEDEVAALDLLTDEQRRAVTNTNTLKFLFG